MNHEDRYWAPDLAWLRRTIFVLGSGPSLTVDDVELLRGRHVIAVNSSYLLCPWAEVLFFMDNEWFRRHSEIVKNWPGMVISNSRVAKRDAPDKVHRIICDLTMTYFPKPGTRIVRQGRSSGQTAVGVAVARGATTVVLLGFDMKAAPDGRTHCHDDYTLPNERDLTVYTRAFLPAFKGWGASARAAGVRVLNATPGSALAEFPMIDLREFLADELRQSADHVGDGILAARDSVAG